MSFYFQNEGCTYKYFLDLMNCPNTCYTKIFLILKARFLGSFINDVLNEEYFIEEIFDFVDSIRKDYMNGVLNNKASQEERKSASVGFSSKLHTELSKHLSGEKLAEVESTILAMPVVKAIDGLSYAIHDINPVQQREPFISVRQSGQASKFLQENYPEANLDKSFTKDHLRKIDPVLMTALDNERASDALPNKSDFLEDLSNKLAVAFDADKEKTFKFINKLRVREGRKSER